MRDIFHICIWFLLGCIFSVCIITILQIISQEQEAIPLEQIHAAFAL